MRSFGLWYRKCMENMDEPVFSLHINFWSESMKKGSSVPDLDIGIKIKNFQCVDRMVFHCPFELSENEIVDLEPKLHNVENANIIFNMDGKVENQALYSTYSFENDQKEDEEKLLLFPLKQNIGHIYSLSVDDMESNIIFDFHEFNDFLKHKKEFSDINRIYIRFRITSDKLKDRIYFDCEPTNKSFESAFSGTRIFDFKINEKRNLGLKTITPMEKEKYQFPEMDRIHLLLMEPSSYDIEAFANPQMTCRELEGELWEDYFETNIDYSNGRILAYHWKFEDKKTCSCLVKVKYSKTNVRKLVAYVLIVLALGVIGSTIVSMIQSICTNSIISFSCIAYGVGTLLFALGLRLGSKR